MTFIIIQVGTFNFHTMSENSQPKYFSPDRLQQTLIKVHKNGNHIRLPKLTKVIDNNPRHFEHYLRKLTAPYNRRWPVSNSFLETRTLIFESFQLTLYLVC